MITQERLLEVLAYDDVTGKFTRLTSAGCAKAGARAGSESSGYLRIEIDGKSYLGHRLAWLYKTGKFPEYDIDHINMNKLDNSWINLREATKTENQANQKKRVKNGSGLKGVSKHKNTGKWVAQIQSEGKYIYLGLFDCPAAASFAYQIAADKLFGAHARPF